MLLFDRFSRGGLRLGSRLIRSAVCEGMASPDGAPLPALVDRDVQLAQSGIGLIIAGMTAPSADSCAMRRQCRLDSDALIPAYRNLTGAVHASGGKIALQIGHAGSRSIAPGRPRKPAEWSMTELEAMPAMFAQAAHRARESGFDAVQLHAAHGYLLSEFLSPCFNARSDAYGGTLFNRARLLLKVYAAVRRAVGSAFPVLVKINSSDFVENGLAETESGEVVKMLADRGLDAAEISGGVPESGPALSPVRRGAATAPYYVEYTAKLRKQISIPLILTGGIRSAETAEMLLKTGVCDLVSLGRPLIAEPDLAARWKAGEGARSVCTGCNRCFRPLLAGRGVSCRKAEK